MPIPIACLFLLLCSSAVVQAAEEQVWTSVDGLTTMRYAVSLPAKVTPDEPLGLILGCHGSGGTTAQLNQTIVKGLARVGLADRYLVIGIHSKGSNWAPEYNGDHSAIIAFLAWAKTTWPIDARQVHMYGFSAGGWITIKLQAERPDLFAGGVCWGSSDHRLQAAQAAGSAPIYWINGSDDRAENPIAACDRARKLIAMGFPIVLRKVVGMGHATYGEPPGDDVFRWFAALRNPNQAINAAERSVLAKISSALASGKPLPLTSLEPLVDLAGPETDRLLVQLAAARKPELRQAMARLCQVRLYGPTAQEAVLALARDKEPAVRRAAIRALGVAANWNRTAARDALIAIASKAGGAADDRIQATGQLGLAAAVQLACDNQDEALFATLRSLAADKDAKLGSIAQAGLDGKLAWTDEDLQIRP